MNRIFHADDDHSDRWDLKYFINALEPEIEVIQFGDGLELAQRLGYTADIDLPAAIILDLRMPIWDGIKTLNALKSEPRFTGIPVYMWSTADTKNEMELCLQLGAEKYIVKPATEEQRLQARIALAELLTRINR